MHSKKFWISVMVLTLIVVFALGWGSRAMRFPLALGLLRIAFLVTEQVWPRVRA